MSTSTGPLSWFTSPTVLPSIGLIEVDSDGHVLAGDGRARDGLFAIGPFTSLAGVGAFTRPNADSLPLRQTDQVARAVVARLRVASVISSA